MEEMNATFQTGSTRPQKSHQGLIAALLILVIFLCGIVTVLSLMNIRLFRLLEKQETGSIAFARETVPAIAQSVWKENGYPGFSCREMDDVYRSYHKLPQGLYITEVTPGSPAESAALTPGDILTKINDTPIHTEETLTSLLENTAPGSNLTLTVYREGKELTLKLNIS